MLNEIAVVGFMSALFVWIHKHPEDLKALSLREWGKEAKRMNRMKYANWMWMTVVFTAILYQTMYSVSSAVVSTGAALSDPSTYVFTLLQNQALLWLMIPLIPIIVISEGWVFWHIIQRRASTRHRLVGIVAGALAFSIYHYISGGLTLYALLPTFAGGVVLGVAYLVGGLRLAVGCQLIYDYLALAAMF